MLWSRGLKLMFQF